MFGHHFWGKTKQTWPNMSLQFLWFQQNLFFLNSHRCLWHRRSFIHRFFNQRLCARGKAHGHPPQGIDNWWKTTTKKTHEHLGACLVPRSFTRRMLGPKYFDFFPACNPTSPFKNNKGFDERLGLYFSLWAMASSMAVWVCHTQKHHLGLFFWACWSYCNMVRYGKTAFENHGKKFIFMFSLCIRGPGVIDFVYTDNQRSAHWDLQVRQPLWVANSYGEIRVKFSIQTWCNENCNQWWEVRKGSCDLVSNHSHLSFFWFDSLTWWHVNVVLQLALMQSWGKWSFHSSSVDGDPHVGRLTGQFVGYVQVSRLQSIYNSKLQSGSFV